jgi:hypothetical protein
VTSNIAFTACTRFLSSAAISEKVLAYACLSRARAAADARFGEGLEMTVDEAGARDLLRPAPRADRPGGRSHIEDAGLVGFQRFRNIGSINSTVPTNTRPLDPTSRQVESDNIGWHASAGEESRINRKRHRTENARIIRVSLQRIFGAARKALESMPV